VGVSDVVIIHYYIYNVNRLVTPILHKIVNSLYNRCKEKNNMPVIKIGDNAKKVFMEYERVFNMTRSDLEKNGQEPALLFAVAAAIEKLEQQKQEREHASSNSSQ